MGDHHQLGDATGVDEAGQLPRQTAGRFGLPHVLLEIAVDDGVVAAVGQALAHRIDDARLPVVHARIGLFAGAMHERDPHHIGRVHSAARQHQTQGETAPPPSRVASHPLSPCR
ncbi:hypothetical protein D3C71_1508690 [compost metagenome]